MTTRYAIPGLPVHQGKYASDPEYVEKRGANGTAVAAKSSLYSLWAKRGLLFWLQSRSLSDGGFGKLVKELLDTFPKQWDLEAQDDSDPEKKLRLFRARPSAAAELQLILPDDHNPGQSDSEPDRSLPPKSKAELTKQRRQRCERSLPEFLLQLCINPAEELVLPGQDSDSLREDDREEMAKEFGLATHEIREAKSPCFKDLVGALLELMDRHETKVRAGLVMTTIGKQVFEALDYCLEAGRMVLIKGNSGVGKTEAVKAWCDINRHSARYVSLKGITTRTAFFREIAKAVGVGATFALSASRIQARVEDFLEKTKLLLVIDEGQYLWPQSERVYRQPELVNWLDTACFNQGVPVAIVATKEFDRRRGVVERQTTWSSEQFARRINRCVVLPEAPTNEDVFAVARKVYRGCSRETITYVAGYAIKSKRFFTALIEGHQDALRAARKQGREEITFDDVQQAILLIREPSDTELERTFIENTPGNRKARCRAVKADPEASADRLQDGCIALSRGLQPASQDRNLPPSPVDSTKADSTASDRRFIRRDNSVPV